jgi:hypothetical protein
MVKRAMFDQKTLEKTETQARKNAQVCRDAAQIGRVITQTSELGASYWDGIADATKFTKEMNVYATEIANMSAEAITYVMKFWGF